MDHAGRGTRVSSSNFGVAAVRFATTRMRAGELIPHGPGTGDREWHRRKVADSRWGELPMRMAHHLATIRVIGGAR